MTDDVKALAARLPKMSYFQILGLPHKFQTEAEVKRAFHVFAQLYHPDQYTGEDPELQRAANEVFKRGVESYDVLRNDALQKRYVRDFLTKGFLRLPPGSFGPEAAKPEEKPDAAKAKAAAAPSPKDVPARAGGKPVPKAPPPREAFHSWLDELETEEGREVGERVERMVRAGRLDAARQQLSILEDLEPGNPAIRRREAQIRRLIERR